MSITTLLVFVIARRRWRWGWPRTMLALGLLLAVDLTFFAANLPKFSSGGWFPLAVAALNFTLMSTWKHGRVLLLKRLGRDSISLADFVPRIEAEGLPTVAGTAVYLTAQPDQVPLALLHSLKHFHCLHQQVVILQVAVLNEPSVPLAQRIAVQRIDGRFQPARLNLGFMDKPNITDTIAICRDRGLPCDPASTTFFLGRETVRPTKGAPMALWRQHLFIGLSLIASSRAAYFNMPPNRVVELGVQLNL